MTRDRLAELQALCEQATPGPWTSFMGSGLMQCTAVMHEDEDGRLHFVADFCPDYVLEPSEYRVARADHIPDMKFVEAARTALPELVALLNTPEVDVAALAVGSAVELPERFVDVAWSRPESREILRCYGLTLSEFVNRLVAASRNYGPGVEIVSIAYTAKRAPGSDGCVG